MSDFNEETLNHKFKRIGEYGYESEPATIEEIQEARKKAEQQNMGARTCWECNKAHAHLIDDFAFYCFGCGKYFYNGIDITDYTSR